MEAGTDLEIGDAIAGLAPHLTTNKAARKKLRAKIVGKLTPGAPTLVNLKR
jgi:hypothetical protein